MTFRQPSDSGSSLLELLVATLIIGLAVASSSQLLLVALAESARASHLAAATWLARAKMEEIASPGKTTGPDQGSDVVSLRSFGARCLFRRTWSIEEDSQGRLLVTVRASARKPFPGRITLSALIAHRAGIAR